MSCNIDVPLAAAKQAIDSAKVSYNNKLTELKSLNPNNFSSRVDFEAEKSVLTGQLSSLKSSVDSAIANYTNVGDTLNQLTMTSIDGVADQFDSVFGGVPGISGLGALVTSMKSMQC